MTLHFKYQLQTCQVMSKLWLAGGYGREIGHFRSGWHGGYLVDSGFFTQRKYVPR